VRLATQVASALAFAHGKGVIHRDLKPANVFLNDDGTAKLGDFGLAAATDRTRLTMHGTFLGTATYMAPEQAMGQPPDPRSDLYALGCVLYEMLTGRPPFVGDDTVAIVTQHLNTPPIAPTWHRPDVPAGLEALVLFLLEKDPAKRPQSAAEVRTSLSAVALTPSPSPDFAGEGSNLTSAASSPQDPIYRQTFVGREAELRQLQAAFDGALSGNGALVMVVGEPGIGKTSVCEQLATYAAMRGGRTLRGHCYEEGSHSLPYLPFVEAMRTYVLDRDPDALRSELGSNAPYVARIVSEVRDRLEVEQPTGGDPDDDRWRLLQGVTTFLRNAANVQPLVIVLEDLHWADKGTLDVLTHIARSLEGARLCIVGTYRDVEVDRSHPLSGALAELRRITNFSRVTLRGLSAEDVQKMLANIAGRDVPWALAEQVHRQTEGNPLFVQEVLRYLVEEGFLQRDSHGALQRPSSDISLAMQIPEGLRDVIGKRLSRLSAETNKVLAVAAVIGRDFRLDVLQDVANVTEEELYAALEEASGKGVLEERRQQNTLAYRFTHAFLRQTLYEEIFTPRRIRTHQQVARAMETRYARRSESRGPRSEGSAEQALADHAAELAEHFAQSTDADDLAKAVHYGELAAQRAMSVYAYAEAVRLLEAALQAQEVLDPDDKAKRCDVLLALGTALLPGDDAYRVLVGIGEEAFQLASAIADRAREFRACRLTREALARTGGGRFEGTAFSNVWADRSMALATPGSIEEVWALFDIARECVARFDTRKQVETAGRAAEIADRLGDSEAYWAAVGMQTAMPLPETFDMQLELVDRFLKERPVIQNGRTTTTLLLGSMRAQLVLGDRERLDWVQRELSGFADRSRDSMARGLAAFGELLAMLHQGRIVEAERLSSELSNQLRQFGAAGVGSALQSARSYLGLAAPSIAELGRIDHGLQVSPLFLSFRAVQDALFGDADVQSALPDVMALASCTGTAVQVLVLEAAARLRDPALAQAAYESSEPMVNWASGLNGIRSPGRLMGECAELLGRFAEARTDYDVALEGSVRLRNRPEIALIRFRLANLLLSHYPDERDEALDHLAFAIGEFQHMKMAPSLAEAMKLRMQVTGADRADPLSSIVLVSTAVQQERPDVSSLAAPDGTVTLMFSDIEDSTPLNERLGDAAWLEVLHAHDDLIRHHVQEHGGFVVKTMGDGFMVAFGSAEAGVRCAVGIQEALGPLPSPPPLGEGERVDGGGAPEMGANLPATGGRGYTDRGGERSPQDASRVPPVRVRIGLHTGEAVRQGDDFYGRHVNFAARVGAAAVGGEVLVSTAVFERLRRMDVLTLGEAREVALKGFEGTHVVYAVRPAS
jgi:class 3 adenylate cyclase